MGVHVVKVRFPDPNGARGMLTVVLCLAIGLSLGRAQTLESTVVWDAGPDANHHTYKLYSVTGPGINWEGAKSNAAALGGSLVTISSAEENALVYDTLGTFINDQVWFFDSSGYRLGPWIGLTQRDHAAGPNQDWEWVTGEPLNYTFWAPNEPNDNLENENRGAFAGLPTWRRRMERQREYPTAKRLCRGICAGA